MRKSTIALAIALSLLAALAYTVSKTDQQTAHSELNRPNILLIVADDLGIMDVCAYSSRVSGSPRSNCYYETPNIDVLADSGITFNRAYAAPLCSPTRAALISGQYGPKLGMNNAFSMQTFETYQTKGIKPPINYRKTDGIQPESASKDKALIGAVSSAAPLASGRKTADANTVISIAEYLSDYNSAFIGKWHIGAGLPEYGPASQGFEEIAYLDEGWSDYFDWRDRWEKPGRSSGQDYLTNEITSQAEQWILNQRQSVKPFFLVVSHFAVHGPYQAEADAIKHFESKQKQGRQGHNNATYAAMISALDTSVGRLRQTLQNAGVSESTVIVFISDNGGVLSKRGDAITSNKPFRGGKASILEGGIRVPLVIYSPLLKDSQASIETSVDVTDLFPTIADFAGYSLQEYSKHGDGQSLKPLIYPNSAAQSYSKSHYFYDPYYRKIDTGEKNSPLQYSPKTVVIDGDYKLIQYHLGYSELYNLRSDPFEATDVALSKPAKLNQLRSMAANWERTIPNRYRTQLNPNYDPDSPSSYPKFVPDYFQQVNKSP